MSCQAAEQAVRDGDLDARAAATCRIRSARQPDKAELRVFLFQLLSRAWAQWERALTQLNVAAELDAGALAMAQMYREAHPVRAAARRGVRRQALAGRSSASPTSGWRC